MFQIYLRYIGYKRYKIISIKLINNNLINYLGYLDILFISINIRNMVQMIGKELFKNHTDGYFVWFNHMEKTISVALLDEYGILIQKYHTHFMEYVVVPSGGTIYFVEDS